MMRKRIIYLILVIGLYLGLQEGYLALWCHGAAEPEKVFPYRAAVYPNMDQKALAEGIPITGQGHLQQLLEDFLS